MQKKAFKINLNRDFTKQTSNYSVTKEFQEYFTVEIVTL
jgi:hypothetical protein